MTLVHVGLLKELDITDVIIVMHINTGGILIENYIWKMKAAYK